MLEEPLALIIAVAVFVFGLVSRRIEQVALTAPMLFTGLGVLISPLLLNLSEHDVSAQGLKTIAEFTLILILFTDASQIERKHLVQFEILPIRLLAIGLPLTIIAGTWVAHTLLGISWLSAALLAVILTPTDAALAQSIFDHKEIDESLRHSVSVESGLNDGLALPVLLLVLALISAGSMIEFDHWQWLGFFLQQVLLGTVVGIAVGRLGGYLVQTASESSLMSPVYQRLSSLSLAVLAYTVSEAIGGNGFISAFMAGLFLQSHRTIVIQRLKEFGAAEGQLLSLLMFFLFGLIYIPEALPLIDGYTVIYALLSLTIIRMIPVFISLIGSGLTLKKQSFLAWFGPRGIASILYLLLAVDELGFADKIDHYPQLFATTVLTIFMSIILHGLSTRLWGAMFAAKS
ncbi:MAG: hypothetical protein COB43_03875 [Oceanospirillales bacterium]|nr:MAG: hypothetical protein COB43_03875 [Oceanospirillales bacterium]